MFLTIYGVEKSQCDRSIGLKATYFDRLCLWLGRVQSPPGGLRKQSVYPVLYFYYELLCLSAYIHRDVCLLRMPASGFEREASFFDAWMN